MGVIKVLKGHFTPSEISIDDIGGRTHSQAPDNLYVYFLTSEPGGYRFTHQHHASAALPAAPGKNLQETVENMIAAAIGSPATSSADRWWDTDVIAGDPSPNPAITRGFEESLRWTPSEQQSEAIAVLIVRHYPPAIGLAEAFLRHRDWAGSAGPIIAALGVAEGDAAFKLLAGAAQPSEPEPTRWYALTALGKTRSPKAVPALGGALHDADWRTRAIAAKSLAWIPLPKAISALAGALDDPNEMVRFDAYESLFAISQNTPGIALDPKDFQKHEAAYIRQWKQWAREHSPGGGQP